MKKLTSLSYFRSNFWGQLKIFGLKKVATYVATLENSLSDTFSRFDGGHLLYSLAESTEGFLIYLIIAEMTYH